MPTIFRYQVDGSENSFQPVRKPPQRAHARVMRFISRDRRRAVWDLVMEHDRSLPEVQRLTRVGADVLSQREILQIIIARVHEEIEKAVMFDRWRRGPHPPANVRRAA